MPSDGVKSDLANYMVTSQSQLIKSFCGLTGNQKVDDRGVCGTYNVCSARCSSCLHVDLVLVKSNDESAIEACGDNLVVAEHRRHESGQMSDVSIGEGMMSTSSSFSQHAISKGSSKTYEASVSDDNMLQSKHGVSEGQDEFMSCAIGTDKLTSAKDELEYSLTKCKWKCKFSGECPDKGSLLASKNDKKCDKPSDTKDKLFENPTKKLKVFDKEAENGVVCSDLPLSTTYSTTKNDDMGVEVLPNDDADNSDMVELDVKVCDICGDAGREYLLAVCSRCSDGAEHTYCMLVKLDKVPEGEWLCEECKYTEGVGNERQVKTSKLDENEKVNFSAQASSERGNSSDFEGNKSNGEIKCTGKRCRDDAGAEVSSIAKKPETVQAIGSPKTKNLGKPAPSLDNSLNNHDIGSLKSSHLSSSNVARVNDFPESRNPASDLRSHGFRGTLSKSISFNYMASKQRVKLVDQVVLQRQKLGKDRASFRNKDGVIQLMMHKSVSFKSTMPNRSESRSTMLSPRLSHVQDNTNIKERSSFERQRSFRSEQPLANSMMATSKNATTRMDKLASSWGESSAPIAIVNLREKKPECMDGKSISLPRSSSFVARRNIESSSFLGEFKKPSVTSRSTVGVTFANGFNNIGKKSSHIASKEDSSSCSAVAERPHYNNNNDNVLDMFPWGRNIANSGERMREQLGASRFLPPSMKSSRHEPRKPGPHQKHEVSDQADDSSVSTGGAEVVSHQDHTSCSNGTKRPVPDVMNPVKNKLTVNFTADSLTQEAIGDLNKSSLVKSESIISGGNAFPLLPSSKDELNSVSVTVPLFLNSAAIPEHEFIWQGSFEINRSGKSFEIWEGIQAHLSTCASPKVVRAVDNFESRILLHEVPRLSTWPTQFRENGVKEDHIALFFFAKDIESYNKNYKILVDKMMTNDLALRGDVNGAELLIFPSDQLHDNMKRWNTLFYIWGVFRGKRENCSTDIPNSSNQSSADISPPLVSLPERRCSLVPVVSELPVSGDAVPLQGPNSEESHNLLLSRTVDEDHRTKISTLDESDGGVYISSSSAIQNNHQERDISSSSEPSVRYMTSSSCCQMEKIPTNNTIDSQQSSSQSAAEANNIASEGVSGERIVLDRDSDKEQSSVINVIEDKDSSKDGETPMRRKRVLKDLNMMPDPEELILDQESLVNGETRNEPCGALETASHVHLPNYRENPERHFFSIESKPVRGTHSVDVSSPWKIHPLGQDQIHDESPNLELALWAGNKTSSMEIDPVEARLKRENDVTASLSLSLSWWSKD